MTFYPTDRIALFIDGSGGAAEGVRLPVAAVLVAEQLPGNHPQKKVALDYIKAYKGKYNEDISTFGGHAYDGLMLALEAVKRAGGTDKAKVRDEIEKTKNFVGADGIFNMSPTDHMGLTLESFAFTANGKLYPLTGRLQPFGAIGLGLMNAEVSSDAIFGGSEDETEFAMRFGAGFDFYFTRNFLGSLDFSYVLPTGDLDEVDYIRFGWGFGYRF